VTSGSGSRRRGGRRLGWLVVGLVGLLVVASGYWQVFGGGVIRREVAVKGAVVWPDRFSLVVSSCQGDPEVTFLRETDHKVEVRVVASFRPLQGGPECFDLLDVELQQPLGDRLVVDLHTGETVPVETVIP
jgi:hypothetical protein